MASDNTEMAYHGLEIYHLGPADISRMRELSRLFGTAFDEIETYTAKEPSDSYLQRLLSREYFIALIGVVYKEVIGGLVAYELHKFEQERSEVYIYDLAVGEAHRRRGIATRLISELKVLAAERDAYVVFVQADQGDEPAIALYEKLGIREEVLHFDIEITKPRSAA